MNIIIDGYNLLKQLYAKKFISPEQRASFLSEAQEYARKKGHIVTIVFDGGPFDRPSKEKFQSVTVVYSGTRASADDIIGGYITDRALSDMLIITTDRQLNALANQAGIPSMDALDFYQFMRPRRHKANKSEGQAVKLASSTASADIDLLMQEASRMAHRKQEEDYEPQRKQTPSKVEKKFEAILKKL